MVIFTLTKFLSETSVLNQFLSTSIVHMKANHNLALSLYLGQKKLFCKRNQSLEGNFRTMRLNGKRCSP